MTTQPKRKPTDLQRIRLKKDQGPSWAPTQFQAKMRDRAYLQSGLWRCADNPEPPYGHHEIIDYYVQPDGTTIERGICRYCGRVKEY